MFSESAEFYDLIYSGFKDYPAEARQIATLLRAVHPRCQTVLDVACSTGEHARLLATEHGFKVDGLDLNPTFVRMARQKHPNGRFVVADMADFHLQDRYDAITCLFSSIGYLLDVDRIECALRCFRKHLAVDGVCIVEPWLAPGLLEPGHLSRHTGEAQGVRVDRVCTTEVNGRVSRLRFEYRVRDVGGVRQVSEVHGLGLFTSEEMMHAFEAVGFAVQHDPHGLTGRGLYVAKIA